MPMYPRRIQLSKQQRPVYFELRPDGTIVPSNGKAQLPLKYITKNLHTLAKVNRKITHHSWLTDEVKIASFDKKGDSVVLPNNESAWIHLVSKKTLILVTLSLSNEGRKVEVNPILGNANRVGKPRFQRINAQDIYSGMNEMIRGKVVQEMKKFMLPFVKDIKIDKYPVTVTLFLYDTIVNQLDEDGTKQNQYSKWDLDNRAYLWHKCFMDLITTGKTGEKDRDGKTIQWFKPLIPGDDIRYVTACGGTRFMPIRDYTERKLVFGVHPDERYFIITNPFFNEQKESETANPW